jgi:hypothetical protein
MPINRLHLRLLLVGFIFTFIILLIIMTMKYFHLCFVLNLFVVINFMILFQKHSQHINLLFLYSLAINLLIQSQYHARVYYSLMFLC